ncbi:hypothetical protein WBG78_15575 [Chryseolinea sp. T2]|uniref:hypothetical protein n=1 Tax=Chryseolinea sp. T2 TaxID=3129255 RepID=UPI0030777809
MAIQQGLIQLTGRIGDLIFYQTDYGYAVRRSGGNDRNRIKNDPCFVRTRESNSEFAEAMKCVKLFRAAFSDVVTKVADGGITKRLSSLFIKLVQQDNINLRGSRKLQSNALAAFEGLEFNKQTSLSPELRMLVSPSIDRSSGRLSVDVNMFSPAAIITSPPGATHFILTTIAAELDFISHKFNSRSLNSEPIPIDRPRQDATSFDTEIAGSTKPLVLAFGIHFVQMINGICYPLKNREKAAMQMVKVSAY